MNPKVKKGIIITSGIAVIVGGIVGAKIYIDSTNTIEVNSVANLNTGYWENPNSSTGFVSNSDTQSIYYDDTKTITQVYVQQGQSVNAGDPLISYDLTTLQSTVETDQLNIDKAKNDIMLAEHELKKLLNTTPDPIPTPTPIPTPLPDPSPLPVPDIPDKDENGYYPYIVSLQQAEKAVTSYTIWYATTSSDDYEQGAQAPTQSPEENPDLWKANEEPTIKDNEDMMYSYWFWIEETYTDGTKNAFSADDVESWNGKTNPSEGIYLVGSKQNPYTFKLLANPNESYDEVGYIYGKLFLDNCDLDSYFLFETYDEDGEVDSSWLVRADKFASKVINEGDMYNVANHTKEEQRYEEIEIPEPSEEPEIDYSGYTELELAKAIRDKKQELKTLDLNLRKAQLTLKEDQALLSDGVVRAKRSGVVRTLLDVTVPPTDGSPILEIAGGSGYYISGTISELMLDQVHVGDPVSCYSWQSGQTIEANIDSIDTFPSNSGYYNGSGNPNVSYYGFVAYVADASSLNNNDYLEITIGSQNTTTSSIWLSKAYVRKEGKKYYVMKDDNGILKKQYVTVGKIVWGDTMEITDGINEMDSIAFAYSKNAKEGVKTKSADSSSGVMYG